MSEPIESTEAQQEEIVSNTDFYGLLVKVNGTWLKRLVVGVNKQEQDGFRRLLTVIERLRSEFPNCPWQEFRVVRIDLDTKRRLQDWWSTIRKEYMIVQLDGLEKATHALVGIFA